jgi:hypothetical protein
MKTLLLSVLTVVAASPICQAAVLWSTGEPQAYTIVDNGLTKKKFVLLYPSGHVSSSAPERLAAVPFRLAQNAMIHGFDAMYSDAHPDTGVRNNPTDVSFIIWARQGLTAPTTIVAEGSLGSYVLGMRYTGPDVTYENDYLHSHQVSFPLGAGDYYLTLYSKDTAINWVTGGRQPDQSLEQNFMWRSAAIPTPGFQQYVFPDATDNLGDSKDIYNPIFSIIGDPVPEPSAYVTALAGLALIAGVARRRQRALPMTPRNGLPARSREGF